MAGGKQIRSEGVYRHVVAIFQLPAEVAQKIVGYLECPYALVSLSRALEDCPLRRTSNFAIDWKNVAYKHAETLLENGPLCKKIQYDNNEKQKYDKMRMRPSDWTRLPQKYTYLQMIRSNQIHPLRNLDGNIVSVDEIEALYEREQVAKRFNLVFKCRVERNRYEKPSKASRKRIGLEDWDLRDYDTLFAQISASCKQGKTVYKCWLSDKGEREIAVGQDEAFRRFFHDLVLDENFEPAACMGCLAMDTTTVHLCKVSQIRLRLCDGCLKDLAKDYKIELVDDKQLRAVGLSMPSEFHASRLLGVMRFAQQKTSYITKANADNLCLMHHGLSYDGLSTISLPRETVESNNKQFGITVVVMEEIIRLQSDKDIWSHVKVNTNSVGLWCWVAKWLNDHPDRARFDRRSSLSLKGATATDLAEQFWKKLLWDIHARKTKGEALQLYRVAQIHELDGFQPHEYHKHPLHASTIHAHEIDQLSYLIHGKSATEALQDLPALCDVRLAFYLSRSAVLVNIIGRYNICFTQAIVDLVAIVSSQQEQGLMQDSKQRLGSFLHVFNTSLMASCPLPSGVQSIKQLQDIPAGFAMALADQVLRDLALGPVYDAVADWARDKQVFVDIPLTPEALSTAAIPEFLQCLMQYSGLSTFEPDVPRMATTHHCGSIHWNCVSIENTLMHTGA